MPRAYSIEDGRLFPGLYQKAYERIKLTYMPLVTAQYCVENENLLIRLMNPMWRGTFGNRVN